MDGPTNETTHHLLLALAGRVDDDLLGWARELAAVGEEARAVSLLTADIAASRLPLPGPVRAALVTAGQAVRVDIDPASLAPAADEEHCEHRFVADVAGQPDVAAALRALPPRRLQGCTVHLAWRLTPAGTAPGPLPHPVVLVEAEPGVRALDVLAYQVATGLARAGVHAGVEVLGVGQPRESYHETALVDALAVSVADAAPAAVEQPVVPEPSAGQDEPPAATASHEVTAPEVVERRAPEPVTETFPEIVEPPAEQQRTADATGEIATDLTADPAPESEPDVEHEFVLDPSRPHPLSDDAIQPPTRPMEVSRQRVVEGAPALSALNDPLNGPLNTPLLPPRFDPTIQPHDPLGIDYLIGPSESARRAVSDVEAEADPADEAPEPVAEAEPAAAEAHPAVDEGWAAEWESGAWAMPAVPDPPPSPTRNGTPHSGLNGALNRGYATEPGVAEFMPAPSGPAHDQPARHHPPEPARQQARPEPAPPRRAEPSNRLSEADRELLARLQAELVEGRKPRVSRQAGIARIRPARTNGSNGDEPPDIAG